MELEVRADKADEVDDIAAAALSNKARYVDVDNPLGIPWYFLDAIHNLESSRRFTRHHQTGPD